MKRTPEDNPRGGEHLVVCGACAPATRVGAGGRGCARAGAVRGRGCARTRARLCAGVTHRREPPSSSRQASNSFSLVRAPLPFRRGPWHQLVPVAGRWCAAGGTCPMVQGRWHAADGAGAVAHGAQARPVPVAHGRCRCRWRAAGGARVLARAGVGARGRVGACGWALAGTRLPRPAALACACARAGARRVASFWTNTHDDCAMSGGGHERCCCPRCAPPAWLGGATYLSRTYLVTVYVAKPVSIYQHA